jgi:D-sedoheptulose 7-phosphate isomerase
VIDHLSALIRRYPVLDSSKHDLAQALEVLINVYESNGKLLVCGNGGSASDCEHIVGELMKGFMLPRSILDVQASRLKELAGELGVEIASRLQSALPAVSLSSQHALITAVANDTHGDMIFAQQVQGLGKCGDAILGITTSGNSRNVINALITARSLGMTTLSLTGRSGGKVLSWVDVAIRVSADNVVEIQELHLPVYHYLCMALESHFFGH